jgi:hypothetical protein
LDLAYTSIVLYLFKLALYYYLDAFLFRHRTEVKLLSLRRYNYNGL